MSNPYKVLLAKLFYKADFLLNNISANAKTLRQNRAEQLIKTKEVLNIIEFSTQNTKIILKKESKMVLTQRNYKKPIL